MSECYDFSYLIGTLAVGACWASFYFLRPDLRTQMLKVSILFGIGGVLSEFVYVSDWWHPTTITGTLIGVEDFMFGFFFSGAVATGYEVLLKKTLQPRPENRPHFRFRYIALAICAIFFGSTLLFGMHSFTATILAFGLATLWMLVLRPDLLANAAFSGLLGIVLALAFFGIPELITPGWVASTWSFEKLSGYFVLFIPLEDFFWFLTAGACIGPLFKFRKNYEVK